MSAANVRNIQALVELKTALVRFQSDVQASLLSAQQEIHRTQEWLAERERHWKRQVEQSEQALRQAQAALARCEASGTYDREGRYYPPNCAGQEREVTAAQQQLGQTRAELENAQQAVRAVQQQAGEFQREAQRLTVILNNDVAKATALLERKIAILQGYIGDSAPTSEEINAITETMTATASKLSSTFSGAAFEDWAITNVFHDKQRIHIPVLLNEHLRRFDDEGIGLLHDRISDNYVDTDGSLWDAKAYDEHSMIDRDQLRDYQLMERAGYVVDAKDARVPITSVNYLFSNRAAAEKNSVFLRGEATLWYVDWNADGSGTVKLFEDQ